MITQKLHRLLNNYEISIKINNKPLLKPFINKASIVIYNVLQ